MAVQLTFHARAAMTKKVPFAGVDVAYEIVGEGTPLVLLHHLFDARILVAIWIR